MTYYNNVKILINYKQHINMNLIFKNDSENYK